MKKALLLSALVGILLTGSLPLGGIDVAAETFKIDPVHTSALFRVMHFGYSRVTGRFNDISGEIVFDESDYDKSQVKVTIKTDSVDTHHEKRDAHLRSPDFFNAKEFPEMTFVSTGVEKTGDKTGKLLGDLTLLGVTKPVTLEVTFHRVAPHPLKSYNHVLTAGFSAQTRIKRSDFGMKYGLQGLSDDVEIILEVEAAKK